MVIVGGGLVGASLACALTAAGIPVTLVERHPPRAASQPSYDDRTLALNHCSCRILDGLGLWPDLAPDATAIREIHVREPGRPGRVTLRAAESGVSAFGHVVEARTFGAVVMSRLIRDPLVELLCPATVVGIEAGENATRLEIDHEGMKRSLHASLVVAADGADSAMRDMLGIGAHCHDYGQSALICNVTPEQPHQGRAYEWLTATGPFAILPHVGGRCGLVWSLPSDDAPALMACSDEEFIERAQRRFGDALGRFRRIGRRSSYALRLVRAEQDVTGRVVFIGNAAHAIHPAGAQGFNLGLRDVAVLAQMLAEAGFEDGAIPALLTRYSAARAKDHDETIAWTHGLVQLFASDAVPAGWLRSGGLLAHALSPALRRRLASRAMGYRDETPRLALGQDLAARREWSRNDA